MNSIYKLLVLTYSITIFSEGIITPIYAVFVQGIGGTLLDASRAVAIFLVTQGLLTLLIHRKRHTPNQERNLLIVGWLLWTLGICTYLVMNDIVTLFIAQFFMGLGNAFCEPLFDKALATHTDRNKQEYERGVFESAKSIIEGIAGVIGAGIATLFGFKWVVILMALSATISFGGIYYYTKVSKKSYLNL